ncbi:unnamed protein product [Taenia asiatica]|uniref:Zinc finger protein n=1 Tax=Taenia asiatica TaxID=60517 RepID=A0A0R3WC90_TAEAS|nr:unnamed protein product [Taenia asiatica]
MAHICDICGASFNRPSRLIIHQRTHTGENMSLEKDLSSSASFQVSLWTKLHMSSASYSACRHVLWYSIQDSEKQSDRRFKCAKCDAAFTTNSKLERHQRRHHDLKCQLCENILTNTPLSKGINCVTGASASSLCPDSIERFENFIELRKHISKYHPNHKFICKICHHRFSRRAHLLEHELSHAPVEERRKFVCTDCSSVLPNPVAFTSKRGLVAHTRAVHSSEIRRFPCTQPSCPAILSTKHRCTRASAPVPSLTTSYQTNSKDGSQRPRRQKCVPLRDLQEPWETESQSSVIALLR